MAIALAVMVRDAEPFLRARIVAELEDHFHAHVELDSFHISLTSGLRAEGKGLRIWPPSPTGEIAARGPDDPLIRLDQFRFRTPLRFDPGKPIHISLVELKGLDVDLPPKSQLESAAPKNSRAGNSAAMVRFEVDRLECNVVELVLGTDKPGKLPLDFSFASLKLNNIASGGAMGFEADLIIPKPVGHVRTKGTFGPWTVSDPGESAVAGTYTFDHADLATFKGIAGILSSTGRYQGTLRDIVADGDTSTPDFKLTHFGNALPLTTHFHAKIDGTNGDTWLEPVDAVLGESHFTAQGKIVRVPASDAPHAPSLGHDIALDLDVDKARIEDFLRLASHSATPLLTGDVQVKAKLEIPPGKEPVPERMKLKGKFTLDQARFTSAKIQDWIEQLSLRGQGKPSEVKTTDPTTVRSHMEGNFQISGGVVTLPALQYAVPGAVVQVKGAYGIDGGAIHFAGTAKMEVPVSKMIGGWKGFLLKPADHFFKKDGVGTEVPIHIDGTREHPKFGIDLDRMKAQHASNTAQ
jgi:hypothetical protein